MKKIQSRLSKLPYLNAKHQHLWGAFTVSDVVRSGISLLFFLTDYLTRARPPPLLPLHQTDRDVEVIDVGNSNTVRTLRDQLAKLVRAGYADTGFPILETDAANGKSRMLGFIGGNELEHALSTFSSSASHPSGLPRPWARAICEVSPRSSSSNSVPFLFFFPGIVADEADHPIIFHPDNGRQFRRTLSISSISSVFDDAGDPFNFNVYMDKVRRSAVKLPLRLFFLLIRVARASRRSSCRLR